MAETPVSNEEIVELERMLKTEDAVVKGKTPQEVALALAQPFDISCRKSKGGFSYIPGAVIRRRVNNATGGDYDFELLSEEYRDGAEIQMSGSWIHVVKYRLRIPGLGFRDGRGTAVIRKGTEEQYKSADTDAFKRCAMEFGCGLELYPGDKEIIEDPNAATPSPAAKATRKTAQPVSALAAAASSLVAAAPIIPTGPSTETMSLVDIETELAAQRQRISATKMKAYCVEKGWAAQTMGALSPEQKTEILEWSRTQPNREPVTT